MLPPATWYPDPSGRHEHRYWDGGQWTEHVADAGIAAIDPFDVVTADDAVNGALAADIASIAMASTTMANDPPEHTPSDLFRRERPHEPDGRHQSLAGPDDPRAERDDPRAGHDEPTEHDGPRAERDHPTEHDGPTGHDRPGRPDQARTGDPTPDDRVAIDDPWDAAAAGTFVMPPDTAADLTGSGTTAAAGRVGDVGEGPDENPPGPGFVLLGDTCAVPATDGRVSIHGGAVTVLLDDDRGVVGAIEAVRRTEGACDLDPTSRSSLRRVTGDGSVTLVGGAPVVLVAVTGGCDVVAAVGSLIALDTAAVLGPVAVRREDPSTFLSLAAPAWLALAPADTATVVDVTPDDDVLVRRGRLLAWTDGLVVAGTRQGLRCRGTGQVLVAGAV